MQLAKVERMRLSHKVLAKCCYEPVRIEKGYASRFLRIDISNNNISFLPVTEEIKKLWVGGKGFDLWFTFQEINPNTKWDSPENPIAMCSGPLGGTTSFPGSGKTIVTSISPLTHSIMDCNVGGYVGPYLKFAGFDGLIIVGKASEEIIVFIDATKNQIVIETAPLESIDSHLLVEELTEMYADDEEDKRNIAIVSSGRAANYVRMGILNFSFWDWRRKSIRLKQAGRGGIGSIFRDKKLKALVIKSRRQLPLWSVTESKVKRLIPVPSSATDTGCAGQYMNKDQIKQIIAKWNHDPEYVIEIMQDIQEHDRHISKLAINTISLETGISKAQLYHIATFYKAFSLVPRGKNIIQVCVGTACHIKGSSKVLEAFERELNIKRGETTSDKNFTLEAVACLGCCSIAPVVKINEDVLGNVQAKDVPKIVKTYYDKLRIESVMTNEDKADENDQNTLLDAEIPSSKVELLSKKMSTQNKKSIKKSRNKKDVVKKGSKRTQQSKTKKTMRQSTTKISSAKKKTKKHTVKKAVVKRKKVMSNIKKKSTKSKPTTNKIKKKSTKSKSITNKIKKKSTKSKPITSKNKKKSTKSKPTTSKNKKKSTKSKPITNKIKKKKSLSIKKSQKNTKRVNRIKTKTKSKIKASR